MLGLGWQVPWSNIKKIWSVIRESNFSISHPSIKDYFEDDATVLEKRFSSLMKYISWISFKKKKTLVHYGVCC